MKEITVASKIENISVVTQFLDSELEAHDCPMKIQMQLDVALDEIFSNIAFYAYAPDVGDVTIKVEFDDSPMVTIEFIDNGIKYDPLAKDDPDVTLSADERSIGGLGIFIVKKTMDSMDYRYEDGKNILKITKSLA